MSTIADVRGRQVLDSRGNPTVEVDVTLDSGARGSAIVPSGASTGVHEAVELRDGGAAYGGKAVEQAVANVNGELAAAVRGRDAGDQARVDRMMIALAGPPKKGPLGATAILGVRSPSPRQRPTRASRSAILGGADAGALPVPMIT
jgi:enolase